MDYRHADADAFCEWEIPLKLTDFEMDIAVRLDVSWKGTLAELAGRAHLIDHLGELPN